MIKRVLYGIAALFAAIGIFFGGWWVIHRGDFDRWSAATPVDMPVDVSRPGTFTGAVHQTCQIAHG